jgi:uncharacterized protein
MFELSFEWEPRKARSNDLKHGVSFEEAATAFSDEHGLVVPDPDHSEDEDRHILLGLSSRLRLLVVVHCLRGAEETIRIISARRATGGERRTYDERLIR